VRRRDQAVDLLVTVVGEREHRPIVAGFAAAHLDAADDAVGAGRGRYLHAIGLGPQEFDGIREVDRRGVEADVDGFDRAGGGDTEQDGERKGRERRSGTNECQETTSELGSRRRSRPDVDQILTQFSRFLRRIRGLFGPPSSSCASTQHLANHE